MEFIKRSLTNEIKEGLRHVQVVAVTGPRQCGKSTLIRYLLGSKELVYLDLERESDLRKLDEAEWFLQSQKDRTICLGEIQRKPEIFQLIRSLVDEWGKNGSFVILGSAGRRILFQPSLKGTLCNGKAHLPLQCADSGKYRQETNKSAKSVH